MRITANKMKNLKINSELHAKLTVACHKYGLKVYPVVEKALEKEISRMEILNKTTSKR